MLISRHTYHHRVSAMPPASVEHYLRAIHRLGGDKPYTGVSLTPAGQDHATTLTRRHRLWERVLTDALGLGWDQVHKKACRLEHTTSSLVEERLAEYLGWPEACPAGIPCPR